MSSKISDDYSYIRPVPEIEVTPSILKAIKQAVHCSCIKEDLKLFCNNILEQLNEINSLTDSTDTTEDVTQKNIPVKIVRDIYNTLRTDGQKCFLHEIVADACLIPQSIQLPPRNPELEERIQKLKREEENREYRRMTRNVDPRRTRETFTFNEEVKTMNKQVVGIINFLVTVVAGFAFGYKGVEVIYGKLFPMQMLWGMVVGSVVFFCDLYFMLKYSPV